MVPSVASGIAFIQSPSNEPQPQSWRCPLHFTLYAAIPYPEVPPDQLSPFGCCGWYSQCRAIFPLDIENSFRLLPLTCPPSTEVPVISPEHRSKHLSPALNLWVLPVVFRIEFRLILMIFKAEQKISHPLTFLFQFLTPGHPQTPCFRCPGKWLTFTSRYLSILFPWAV